MTWEELEEVRRGVEHIKVINEELRLIDEVLFPSKADGAGHSSSPSSPVEQHFRRKQALTEKLERERDQMQAKIDNVERWLATVERKDIVQIVRLRFLVGHGWKFVARKVYGYADRMTPYMALKRYLES